MITLIFTFLLIAFIGKIAMLAIRAAWGLTKVLFTIVLFFNFRKITLWL